MEIEFDYKFTEEEINRKKENGRSKYDPLFEEFLASDKPNCVITLNSPQQRNTLAVTLKKIIKKRGYPIMCGVHGSREVYMVKHK